MTRAQVERAQANEALEKARKIESSARIRRLELERSVEELRVKLTHEAHERAEAAFAGGLASEKARAEHAERALAGSRKAEESAIAKARLLQQALSDYRDRMKEVAQKLTRREAQARARYEAEIARREAVLEEERARLRAESEDSQARVQAELDKERVALQARWREQAELIEKLRRARGPSPEP